MKFARFGMCCGLVMFLFSCMLPVAPRPALVYGTTPPLSLSLDPPAQPFPKVEKAVVKTSSDNISKLSSATCAVTQPPQPAFIPPLPNHKYPSFGGFWVGTDQLWTALPTDSIWSALPHNPTGYTQKVFWWRKGYDWRAEPEPDLLVTGRRLDAPAPPLIVSKATNAFAEDIQSAMLVGVDFPTLGCWEITGRYAGAELSFVILVTE